MRSFPPHNRPQRNHGFTLVELLVVFAIMGLLIAVVPGSFGRLQDSVRYKDTLRAVIAEMRDARYRASMERREVRFSVDLKSRQFGIEGKEFKRFADGIEIRATVADKELDPNGVASIRFLPQGGATGGNLEVFRPQGGGVRIKVDWLSGQVSQEPLNH
ncbi:MAG: prepilin-type N-terminal cleavage/methylation domain-containing protein [Betaproteobacteria bacterium]|nr:prepilin-type N-terminal cleavage/methylation domain-containing protein [Betaproteobacteria bacterium]MBP6645514.1 prepilin-type N-terminal cleavage/methylation domain-containing protein [Burkholderiaceae bacterium]